MDMQSVKVDPAKIENGDWVGEKYETPIPEMGDLCLKVRGMTCAAWRSLARTLSEAVPRNKKAGGRIKQAEQDQIFNKCLLSVGLLDWSGVTENGKEVPYSKEAATRFLMEPEFQSFRDAALWATQIVGSVAAAAVEDDAKNSVTS